LPGGHDKSQFSLLSNRTEKKTTMIKNFLSDEAGVIVSAEIVLVATILVLGMIVGLGELQSAIVGELSDVATAFGNVDQSYSTSGYVSYKASGGIKSRTYGAAYYDVADECDGDENLTIVCDDPGEQAADGGSVDAD